MGASAGATLLTNLGAQSSPTLTVPELAPADVVSLRFPAEWDEASLPAGEPVAAQDDSAQAFAASDPKAASDPGAAAEADPKASAPNSKAAASDPKATYMLASATAEPVPAPRARAPLPHVPATVPAAAARSKPSVPSAAAIRASMGRPGAVFNDAQIASIKRRLHLTPYQERDWPAVEAALHELNYRNNPALHGKKPAAQTAALANVGGTIDPNSAEVQNFKTAAFPLVMSFNEEQKSEVRMMAHLIGLDNLATSF
jgi:hypothetical protein